MNKDFCELVLLYNKNVLKDITTIYSEIKSANAFLDLILFLSQEFIDQR